MFPDFPEYKARAQKLFIQQIEAAVFEIAPILREVHTFRQHEGDSGKLARSDGTSDIIDFPEIASEVKLNREEFKSFDPAKMDERLLCIAKDFATAQMQLMINKISEAANSVGNIVTAKGGEFTPEFFFDMLRKIRIDFDPLTKIPRLPSFLGHPAQEKAFRDKMDQWQARPEHQAEYERILQDKFEEWRARENLRKLVD